jgi:hypothetical protein|tara:strand:- start:3023 stop:3232 length:210 start_codon:yes stop_codon:yes gene_type:complete
MLKELLARRDVRKGLVDILSKGIGFAVAGIALLATDLDPEIAAGLAVIVAAAADIGRRRLRDWSHGAPG